ncbi:MAG: alpha/beta hydrolase [Saprospiraceae bacterium]|nr:alpha/beta hydrolase [Saprospiraceae bacterium]
MMTLKMNRYDVKNIEGCKYENYTLTTADGLQLKLARYYRSTSTPAVLLLHGLTSSSEMFLGEEYFNLTAYMLENGLEDVWLLDWRGSGTYKKDHLTLNNNVDEVAFYDIPLAVNFIQENTTEGLHIVAHCIGSMALAIGLATKKVKNVRSVILGNAGLFPKLNIGSMLRLYAMPQFTKSVLGVDHFVVDPEDVDFQDASMLLMQASNFAQNQCENPSCKMLSLVWGAGHKNTLFNHDNFLPETHDKVHEYLGPVSLSYFRHIQKMLHHNAVLSLDGQTNYLDLASNINVPLLLAVGTENLCWYDSIQRFHELLNTFFEDVDQDLLEIPKYGHMDLFMGKNAYSDVFPQFLDFLKQH